MCNLLIIENGKNRSSRSCESFNFTLTWKTIYIFSADEQFSDSNKHKTVNLIQTILKNEQPKLKGRKRFFKTSFKVFKSSDIMQIFYFELTISNKNGFSHDILITIILLTLNEHINK